MWRAHQQLIVNVARTYFTLDGADAAVRAARHGLAIAKVVQQSAEALFGRGLDTIVDVQLARRATAQAQYDLAQANTAQHEAMYTLFAAMDLPPTMKLRVADASERPLPTRTVDDVLSDALRQRPACSPTWRSCARPMRKSRPHAPPYSRKFR
jgi:outer membrane protein TolC